MLSAFAAFAQTGPQVLTYHSAIDASEQPYALYLPHSFTPGTEYPLVISLHAEDSSHRLNLRQVLNVPNRFGDVAAGDLRYFPLARDAGFIVACPYAHGTMGYQGVAEADVYDVLADVERRFPVDRDRVYLTGISMGGGGALWLALTRPDVWAAVAPVSPIAPPGTSDLAPNALNLPIRIFQGDDDAVAPAAAARGWQRSLLDAGSEADYIEYPGVHHNAWELAYRNGGVFDWFANFRRNRSPRHVRFVTRAYRYSSAYWVRIDGLTPGLEASIDARQEGALIEVETHNVDGFTLTPETAVASVVVDGVALRPKPGTAFSAIKQSGRWRPGFFAAEGKRAGAEGPLAAAVWGRHIYVYGTQGPMTAGELEERRRVAQAAANWSTPRSRVALALPVKADRDVTAEDMDGASLVLFGTARTNSLVARLAPVLPLALHPDAADYGLLFVAANGKHEVLVCSGLPWWSGAEEAGIDGDRFAPPIYRLLGGLGDFILFKGSLTHVVVEGRFDRNWKVPADAASRMRATGTVTIR